MPNCGKNILPIMLLLIICSAFNLCYAQEISLSDTLAGEIQIRIRMIGFGYSVNVGGTGAGRTPTAPMFTWSAVADTLLSSSEVVHPCDFLTPVFWIENIGGIVLDFDIWERGMTANWSKSATATNNCTLFTAHNFYGSSYMLTPSDGDSLTPDAGSLVWTPLPTSIGATREYLGLQGSDWFTTQDGIWASERDQLEIHLGLLMPFSSTVTAPQRIVTYLIARVPL